MAIFNQVVKGSGGGSSVQEPYLDFSVNNGSLGIAKHLMSLTGITDIGLPYLRWAYKDSTTISGPLSFGDLSTIGQKGATYSKSGDIQTIANIGDPLEGTFANTPNITSVDATSIQIWGGEHFPGGPSTYCPVGQLCFALSGITSFDISNAQYVAFGEKMFWGCDRLTTVDCSSAEEIWLGSDCFKASAIQNFITNPNGFVFKGASYTSGNLFYGCLGLTTNPFENLTGITVKCTNICYNCVNITTGRLDKLVSVNTGAGTAYGGGGISGFFLGCSSLVSASAKLLEEITVRRGFGDVYSGCSSLPTMKFESLKTLTGQNCMLSCFSNCSALQSLWFYALDTNSFGTRTDQFSNLLSGCTNVTVHFPIRIQSTIGSWSDVTNGFGGTNTTVLFDIVTTLTGADGNTYTRQEKDSTTTATAWVYNDTLYYTSGVSDNTNGVNEPTVSDAIYSDAACQNSITTITAIS